MIRTQSKAEAYQTTLTNGSDHEPGWNTHKADEIGIDEFQANRSPDKSYRTAPLRAYGRTAKRAHRSRRRR
jgi:hypothetical protein